MRLGIMVLFLLFSTACGGDGGSSGPSSTSDDIDLSGVDVCSQLDEAMVQRLTGVSVPFASQGSGARCFSGASKPGIGAYVEVRVFRSKGLSGTTSGFGPPCTTAPLDGVGEEAEVITCLAGQATPQSKVQLRAYERGIMVTILVNDADVAVPQAELVSATQSVLAQLRGGAGGS